MATATAEAAVIVKMCMVCREDCAGRPRVKDTAGRYVCKSCLLRIEERRKAIEAAALTRAAGPDITVLDNAGLVKAVMKERSGRSSAAPAPSTPKRQPAKTPMPPSTRAGSGTPIHASPAPAAKSRPTVVTRPISPGTPNPLTRTAAARPVAHTNIELKPWAIKRPARSAWLMVAAMATLTLIGAGLAIWLAGAAPLMLGALIAATVAVWVMLTFSACERGTWWGIGVFILPPVAMTFGIGFARDIRMRAATALVTAAWLGVAFWFIANRGVLVGA